MPNEGICNFYGLEDQWSHCRGSANSFRFCIILFITLCSEHPRFGVFWRFSSCDLTPLTSSESMILRKRPSYMSFKKRQNPESTLIARKLQKMPEAHRTQDMTLVCFVTFDLKMVAWCKNTGELPEQKRKLQVKIDCVYVTVKARKRDEKKGERGTSENSSGMNEWALIDPNSAHHCEEKKANRCECCNLEYCPHSITEKISPAQSPLLLLDIKFF